MATKLRPKDGTSVEVGFSTGGFLVIYFTDIHGEQVKMFFTDWNAFDDFLAKLEELQQG